MKTKRTPHEKKLLSYIKDGVSSLGEHSKAARKNIRFRKHWVNHSYRHHVKQALHNSLNTDIEELDKVDEEINKVVRKEWKRQAERPIGFYFREKGKIKKLMISRNKIGNYILLPYK